MKETFIMFKDESHRVTDGEISHYPWILSIVWSVSVPSADSSIASVFRLDVRHAALQMILSLPPVLLSPLRYPPANGMNAYTSSFLLIRLVSNHQLVADYLVLLSTS